MIEYLRLLSGSLFGISILFTFYFGFHYAFFNTDLKTVLLIRKRFNFCLILTIISSLIFISCKFL